jgi:proteasome accessory factor B
VARITKTERLLNLVSYLLKERRPVPWRAIVGRVVGYDDGSDPKSLERRFERDKAALKDMGIPIRYHPPGAYDTEGYMIPREAAFLDEADLSPHEVSLLNLISELALRNRTEYRAELVSALRKLSFDVDISDIAEGRRELPKEKRRRRGRPPARGAVDEADEGRDAWHRAVLHLNLMGSLRAEEQLPTLMAAVVANRTVRFRYESRSGGDARERTLDPYGLGYAHGTWYLVGRDHDRAAIRMFNLRRLRSAVEPQGEPHAFRVPEDFDIEDHIERPAWQFSDAPAERVVIEAGPDIGWFLEGPIAKRSLEVKDDGSVVMTFDVRRRDAFINWVLPKLRHVRIREPEALRDELRRTVDEMVERYGSAVGAGASAANGGAGGRR